MNDFEYDCYQKKVIAQSAKKKVRQKKGCTLPSDYLTAAEKKKLSGEVEIMNPDSLKRPIKYGYFKMLAKEQQEGYLNWLIETYGVTLQEIAKMMETNGNTLSKYCNVKDLNILTKSGVHMPKSKIPAWCEFCGMDIPEIVEEPKKDKGLDLEAFAPIDYETFKKLRRSAQKYYLTQLILEFGVTKADIAKMMGAVPVTLRLYISNNNLDIPTAKQKDRTQEQKIAWKKFCGIEVEETKPVMDIPKANLEPEEILEKAKVEKEKQYDKAIEMVKKPIMDIPTATWEQPEGSEPEKTPVQMILPEKSRRKKQLVNYEYHLEFQNLTRWQELFDILKTMPLPEDGVVHIEVASGKPEEKADDKRNAIGFANPPETIEV